MSTHVPTCPGPDAIEALAHRPPGPGDTAHEALVAHVARCPDCAEALRAARFANRFSRVLLGDEPTGEPAGNVLPAIPGYRVEREISRGAQGVVYEAVQLKSGQRVAVKLLHERGHASPTCNARFGREIQIAGALSHPGIVRLLDSMVLADGSDALIMERIDGRALSQWLESSPKPTRNQVIEVLASVGDALHHAHQRGVIHRDLKPSNILIDEHGRARVLDFGIARWTDASRDARRVTLTGEFAGTLAYAAPEQVGETRSAADIRSEIYALGVIAYEALAGAMPYEVHGSLETTIWNIVHAEPARTTLQGLGTDLAIVLAKAIAKEPERRYQTAAEFARDLRHAVRGEAIDARRDSRIYMLRKSIRRHRFGVAIGTIVALFAIVMLAVLAVSNARLSNALRESRIERLRTLAATGSRAKAEAILWSELDGVSLRGASSDPMAGVWSGDHELRRCVWAFLELQGAARCVSRRSMGVGPASRVMPVGSDRLAVIQGPRLDFRALTGEAIFSGVMMPEGSDFLAMTPDGRHAVLYRNGAVEVWEIRAGHAEGPLGRLEIAPSGEVPPLAEARNGVVVVSTESISPAVFSIPQLSQLAELSDAQPNQRVWISADSAAVVYLARDGTLRQADAHTGSIQWERAFVQPATMSEIALPSSGVRLALNELRTCAVAMLPSSTYVLDLPSPRGGALLEARGGVRVSAWVNPEGTLVGLASFGDSRLRILDARTREEVEVLTGHDRTVGIHGFTSDGSQVVTIDSRFDLRIWDAPGHGWRQAISESIPQSLDPAMSPQGNRIYFGSDQRRLVAASLGLHGVEATRVFDASASTIACCPDGHMVASAAMGSVVHLVDTRDATTRSVDAAPGQRIQTIRIDPTGARVAAATMEGSVVLVRVDDATVEHRTTIDPPAMISSVRFVGEKGPLAVAARDGNVHLFDATSLEPVRTVRASDRQIRSLAVSPDAKQIAAVGDSGQVLLINVATGRVRSAPHVSEDAIFCVTFHPDGNTILIGDRAGVVTVVDVQSLSVLASFGVHAPVTSIIFEPGGDRALVCAIGRRIERWDFAALAGTMDALRPQGE